MRPEVLARPGSRLCHVTTLRIGVLGAARITPAALIRPAKAVDEVEVSAVAARDPERAAAFAQRHGIPRSAGSYEELVADPDLDAIYVPLPNARHAEWTLAALAAGKHVLCEKPLTSNAAEATVVAAAAEDANRVVMEAFHYRYHPMFARALELSATLGPLNHVETELCFPLPRFGDIRYQLDLAGGAMMDAGCYAVHAMRTLGVPLGGGEPEVVSARAALRSPQVDRMLVADYRFPSGATARTRASMWSRHVLGVSARVVGEEGELRILNYLAPQVYHRLTVRTAAGTRRERIPGEATYTYQLRAFAGSVLRGEENLTPASDAVNTMGLIDAAYRAAGLDPRG
ncbi:MAG: binding oxidoreductase [Actinomycetia bacterium]|nr:binding oxidoreductase [Actinomycetes bacterium]